MKYNHIIMKRFLLLSTFLLGISTAWSQENMITINGGYAFANVDDFDNQATGWRINGVYEYNPQAGKFAHGVALGYARIQASEGTGQLEKTGTVSSLPFYYAPKISFGEGGVNLFVKGDLEMQIAWLKREGILEITDMDIGFYGGGGAGLKIDLGEKLFINAEYEIAWVSNSFYNDGWLNNAMAGIGFKF